MNHYCLSYPSPIKNRPHRRMSLTVVNRSPEAALEKTQSVVDKVCGEGRSVSYDGELSLLHQHF